MAKREQMAATIPTGLPAQIRAGSTFTFKISLTDFPASDSWSVNYSFRAAGGSKIDFGSTADGVDHLISVSFTDTAAWLPAKYSGTGIVTNGTQKFEFWRGNLAVLPDIAASDEGQDFRTQARRTLDNINAVLESRASSTILKSAVEGTVLDRIPHADLLNLRDRYMTIVANEENAEATAQGGANRKNIFARFTTPR